MARARPERGGGGRRDGEERAPRGRRKDVAAQPALRRVAARPGPAPEAGGPDPRVDALFASHAAKVFALARRFGLDPDEAEDAVQEVFLKVQRKIGTFRGEARLSTWLYQVAVNALRDQLRRLKRQKRALPLLPLEDEPGEQRLESDDPGPAEGASLRERRALVRTALDALPERFREVLVLRELEGLGYRDIARILELPQGTVESRIHRARTRLAAELRRLEASL